MASDLTSQIATNYIPSEAELDHIKNSILPKPIAKLADLEREIDRIQEVYSSLMEQRQALLAEIEGYQSLISPARRLPIDILQEIFLHTLPTTHNALMDQRKCPLLLTQICHGWRKIALSTPQLWSSIHITIPHIARGHPRHWGHPGNLTEEFRVSALSFLQNYATYVANWLGRSAECPLSISLYDSRDSFSPEEYYNIIINSFLPHACRWKTLVLDTRSPFLGRIAKLTEYDVPLLESLTLHDIMDDETGSGGRLAVWGMSGIIKSHRLKKIDYQIEHNITNSSFKWAQLTDIKLSQYSDGWGAPNAHVSLKDLVVILSLAPRLINFHSEIRLTADTGLASPPSISFLPLLYLQKMVFHDGGANCKPLFDLLNVPLLLHLDFFPTDTSSITVLSTFLPQVAGTILSLTTPYFFFVKPNHHPALSQCHKLTSITIKSPTSFGRTSWSPALVDSISDIFLDDLILPTGHPERLAPALEVFNCQTGGNFSDVAILKFIKTKQSRPDIAKLKRISIQFNRPKEVDLFSDQEFLQYVADGLDVDLRYLVGLDSQDPFVFIPEEGVQLSDPDAQYQWAPNWA